MVYEEAPLDRFDHPDGGVELPPLRPYKTGADKAAELRERGITIESRLKAVEEEIDGMDSDPDGSLYDPKDFVGERNKIRLERKFPEIGQKMIAYIGYYSACAMAARHIYDLYKKNLEASFPKEWKEKIKPGADNALSEFEDTEKWIGPEDALYERFARGEGPAMNRISAAVLPPEKPLDHVKRRFREAVEKGLISVPIPPVVKEKEQKLSLNNAQDVKNFIFGLDAEFKAKGYRMVDVSEDVGQAKIDVFLGNTHVAQIYTTENDAYKEIHVFWYKRESSLSVFPYQTVTKEQILRNFHE